MIQQHFPSKRTIVTSALPYQMTANKSDDVIYSPEEIKQAKLRKITPAEYMRRNALVQKLSTECGMQTGDTAYPSIKKDYDEYGMVVVVGVSRSYKDFSYDHVWKNDNPMVVTFAPLKNRSQHVFCTSNYLAKKDPFAVVC